MTEIDFTPYRVLASTIILAAIEDYTSGQKEDVDEFVYSDWFDDLSDIAGVDPASVREKLITDDLVDAKLIRDEVYVKVNGRYQKLESTQSSNQQRCW